MNITNALQAGYGWEKTVFGKSSQNAIKKNFRDIKDSLYEALDMEQQKALKWDPKYPGTPFAKEMFTCIQSYLPRDLSEHLEMYSAVGLSLDFHHNIDGFFILNCGNRAFVSFDLSTKYKKSDIKLKADLLLSERMYGGPKMWRFCKEVAEMLISRHSAD